MGKKKKKKSKMRKDQNHVEQVGTSSDQYHPNFLQMQEKHFNRHQLLEVLTVQTPRASVIFVFFFTVDKRRCGTIELYLFLGLEMSLYSKMASHET